MHINNTYTLGKPCTGRKPQQTIFLYCINNVGSLTNIHHECSALKELAKMALTWQRPKRPCWNTPLICCLYCWYTTLICCWYTPLVCSLYCWYTTLICCWYTPLVCSLYWWYTTLICCFGMLPLYHWCVPLFLHP